MSDYGITAAGEKLQESVDSLPNFAKHPVRSEGDSVYLNESLGIRAMLENKDGSMNQIRPYKNCIVIYRNKRDNEYFVIPASDILRLAAKRRGQHTPDPFVCVGLGSPKSKTARGEDHPTWSKYKVDGGIGSVELSVLNAAIKDAQPENHRLIQWAKRHYQNVEQSASAAKASFVELSERNT